MKKDLFFACDNVEFIKISGFAWFGSLLFPVVMIIVLYFFSKGYIYSSGDLDLTLLNFVILVMSMMMINVIIIFIKIKTTKYFFCNHDGMMRIGGFSGFWLMKNSFLMDISGDMSVVIAQGMVGRIFGFGDIYIYKNDSILLSLRYIKSHEDVFLKIISIIKSATQDR